MKKTKKIELVLITALLASCNRELIPPASSSAYPDDPGLLEATTHDLADCDVCAAIGRSYETRTLVAQPNGYVYPEDSTLTTRNTDRQHYDPLGKPMPYWLWQYSFYNWPSGNVFFGKAA